jgi:hypothetical protein
VDLQACVACGAWLDEPEVRAGEAVLVCGGCGHVRAFLRLPLFAVTGPSGAGKSTVCRALAERLRGRVVALEQDLLWVGGLAEPDPVHGHRLFRTTWLRLAAAIGQSTGQPVLLCGTVLPEQLEACPQRPLFSAVRYLALVCDDDELAGRLAARPPWRRWDRSRIDEMVAFNRWVRRHAASTRPPMRLLDTTGVEVEATVERVRAWLLDGLAGEALSDTGATIRDR